MFVFKPRQINKTSVVVRGRESELIEPLLEKVEWISINVDYEQMSDREIAEEYAKLRKELSNINSEVGKRIEKVNIKTIRKQRTTEADPIRTLELQVKEIGNNEAILDRIRKEYFQLQKRATAISLIDSKLSLDEQIEAIKKECDKTKTKIKEIKLKNKSIGDSITNTDDLYEEIRRLEAEKDVIMKRKLKLHDKNEHAYEQISAIELKLEEISDNFTIAENYFEEYHNKSQQSEKQKELTQKLRQAKHNFEIVNRKNEIVCNAKQQKYHGSLKTFEKQMERLNLVQQKISSLELETIHCKKVIRDYETLLNTEKREQYETIEEKPIFYTEINQNPSNSVGEKEQSTSNVNSHFKIDDHSKEAKPTLEKGPQSEEDQSIFNPVFKTGYLENTIQIKAETTKSIDPEEEQDIIMELDEKFKSSPKNLRKSRYNERETELGEEIGSDSVIDEDDEMVEFKNKVKEEHWKRNSKEELAMHMSELNFQLESVNIMKSKTDEIDEDEVFK